MNFPGIFNLAGVGEEAEGLSPQELVSRGLVDPQQGLMLGGLLGLDAPVDPGSNFREYMAQQDGAKGFFGAALNPLLSRMIFSDDFSDYKTAKATYGAEKTAYDSLWDIASANEKHMFELSAVDPQVQELADYYKANGMPLKAMQLLAANSVKEIDVNDYTLNSGETRLNGFNQTVASGGDPVAAPPAAVAEAQAIARAKGIPFDDPIMGDLIAATSEPTETRVDASGNSYSVNTVNEVLSRWERQSAATQPASVSSAANPAGQETQGNTPQGFNSLGPVLSGLNEKQAQLVTEAPDKLKFYERFGTNLSQLGTWDEKNKRFILNEDATDLYGSWDSNPLNPQNWNGFGDDGDNGGFGGDTELFMPQGNRDAKAVIEQLIESLAVDERGQLKGQGQITEGETAMLRAAVTRAAKRGMSDKAAEEEFTRLYLEYQKALAEQQGLVNRYWPERADVNNNIIDLDNDS